MGMNIQISLLNPVSADLGGNMVWGSGAVIPHIQLGLSRVCPFYGQTGITATSFAIWCVDISVGSVVFTIMLLYTQIQLSYLRSFLYYVRWDIKAEVDPLSHTPSTPLCSSQICAVFAVQGNIKPILCHSQVNSYRNLFIFHLSHDVNPTIVHCYGGIHYRNVRYKTYTLLLRELICGFKTEKKHK